MAHGYYLSSCIFCLFCISWHLQLSSSQRPIYSSCLVIGHLPLYYANHSNTSSPTVQIFHSLLVYYMRFHKNAFHFCSHFKLRHSWSYGIFRGRSLRTQFNLVNRIKTIKSSYKLWLLPYFPPCDNFFLVSVWHKKCIKYLKTVPSNT